MLPLGQCSSAAELHKERLQLGEKALQEVSSRAVDSREGLCWKEAVEGISTSCSILPSAEQNRLALAFTNCYLESLGRKTYPCPLSVPFKDCVSEDVMEPAHLVVFAEFFTHTSHMCYFLKNAVWQQRTEELVHSLSSVSAETVRKLAKSLENHDIIEEKQNAIIEQFRVLERATQRQQDLLMFVHNKLSESIDGVQFIMSWWVIEWLGVQTVVLAFTVYVIILLLPRFGHSRLCLTLLLLFEVAMEFMLKSTMNTTLEQNSIMVSILCKHRRRKRGGGRGKGGDLPPPQLYPLFTFNELHCSIVIL